jgi:hypothetical protein
MTFYRAVAVTALVCISLPAAAREHRSATV